MDFPSRLLLFLEVVEMETFTKVAEHRNVDRSVISKQITRLEDELDVRLLNRTTRSISLTAAGAEMVKQAKQLRSLLSDTKRLAQNYHTEPRGLLRITCPSYLGRHYIHAAAVAFQKEYPDVEIELRLEDRLVDLVGEGYDIGFRLGKPKDSSLITTKIARNRMLLVAAPSLLDKHGTPKTIFDVERLPAAIFSTSGIQGDRIKYSDGAKDAHFKLNTVYKSNEDELYLKAAIDGVGIACVLAYMIHDEILDGKLVPIMTDLKLADFGECYAVYPHKEAPIKTKLFIRYLKEHIGSSVPIWEKRIPNFDQMYI